MSEEYPNKVSKNPLVSVCMITYNHVPYIARAIESVLAQETDFPYELCIGEDESNDGTREICIDYAKKYPDRIRLFLRSREDVEYHWGKPTGRANGLKTRAEAHGKYLTMLEGDDYWLGTEKLQRQAEYLEAHPECSFSAHLYAYSHAPGCGAPAVNFSQGIGIMPPNGFFNGSFVHVSTMMLRAEHYNIPPVKVTAGDRVIVLWYTTKGACAVFPNVWSVYTDTGGGSWSSLSLGEKHHRMKVERAELYRILPEHKEHLDAYFKREDRQMLKMRLLRCLYFFQCRWRAIRKLLKGQPPEK